MTEAVYGDTYFENKALLLGDNTSLFGYTDYISERFNKQPQYAKVAREILALLPRKTDSPRLLEVGCGLGYFLNEAFEEGFEVSGIEFNHYAVERLKRKYAFPISSGALEDMQLGNGSVDAVAMFDVIEHLRAPFSCLDKLYDALTPGGLLVISTLDAESPVSRLLGSRLEDFRRTREHLFFFGRETLAEVLDEHGFEAISMRSIGHTFELSFLLDRLALYNRTLFSALGRLCELAGIGGLKLHINPHTKIIALARKRGTRQAFRRSTFANLTTDSTTDLDRVLVDELYTLETATPRHYKWVFDIISPYLGKAILEVASGIGVMSKFMIPRSESLILSDYKPVFLQKLGDRFGEIPHLRYQLLDLNAPPFEIADAKVDTIVCQNALEHLEDEEAIVRGFYELLPTGGHVILQVPNYPRLYGSLDRSYGHFRRYSPRALRSLLEGCGFDVVALRRFNPFSIPGWFVTAKLLRAERLNVRSLRSYDKLVPVLRVLDFLSRAAGLSLIAVGEKR